MTPSGGREKLVSGFCGGLPHSLERIVITENEENFLAFPDNSGFLPLL
jgi:hypothetical protein